MARHHEKLIESAQAVVASVGQKPERTDPMRPDEVESFILGFGLSGAAARRLRSEWLADQARAYSSGYDDGRDAVYDDQQDGYH